MPTPLPNSIDSGIPPAAPVKGAAAETTMKVIAATPNEFFFSWFVGIPASAMTYPRNDRMHHSRVPILCCVIEAVSSAFGLIFEPTVRIYLTTE